MTPPSHGKSRLRHLQLLTVSIQGVGGRGARQATLSNVRPRNGTLSLELNYVGLLFATVELIMAEPKNWILIGASMAIGMEST